MTVRLLHAWLPWLLPPLLGAVIGYLTNAVAIRMLFRPLTERRIFGVRVPLTPGIIPRRRAELAESIGRMVSERLITREALERRITSAEFRSAVEERIGAHTSPLLQTPLGELHGGRTGQLYDALQTFSSEILRKFFASRSFSHAVQGLAASWVRSLAGRRLGELVDPKALSRTLAGRICPLLRNPGFRRWARRQVGQWVDARLVENTRLGELVPEPLRKAALDLVRSALPGMLKGAVQWLRRPATRRELEIRGKFLLQDVLAKLSVVQRFFVSVAQYDRTLEEKMPEIVDDVITVLQRGVDDEEVRVGILVALERSAAEWTAKGVFDIVYESAHPVRERAMSVVDAVLDLANGSRFEEGLRRRMEEMLRTRRERTVGELASSLFGVEEVELSDVLAERALRYAGREDTAGRLSGHILSTLAGFLEDRVDTTVGELFRLEESQKSELDAFLGRKFVELLQGRLPELVDSLKVRSLVVDKINELDVSEVESLLLMVISKQLKWINIFGAFLGALIGFSQVLARVMGAL